MLVAMLFSSPLKNSGSATGISVCVSSMSPASALDPTFASRPSGTGVT